MSISEMIAHVGDGNVEVQGILHSSPTITHGKKDTRITFHTAKDKGQAVMDGAFGSDAKYIGLIVWLPTEKLKDLL